MTTEVRAARCATIHFETHGAVWEHWLTGRKVILPLPLLTLAGLAPEFTTLNRSPEVLNLIRAGVLIERNSPAHDREERALATWGGWNAAAHYHHATHTGADHPYADPAAHDAALHGKATTEPPPPQRFRAADSIDLPPVRADWGTRRIGEVMATRRTVRDWDDEPVSLNDVADLLAALAKPTMPANRWGTVRRLTPSGGGRHPIDVSVHARNVEGLGVGWYRYNTDHTLTPTGVVYTPDAMTRAAGDQEWVGAAPVVLAYSAVLARTRWRYATERAYRVVLLDAGHLSQTAYLVATALGLGCGYTAALRDRMLEDALGLDDGEPIIGLSAVGWPG